MRSLLATIGFLSSLGCTRAGSPAPALTSMDPSSALAGESVAVAILGSFSPTVSVDFATGKVDLNDDFTANLGATRLEDVHYASSTQLNAIVPSTLPVGRHVLSVEDPAGRRGAMPDAFAVLSPVDPASDGGDPGDTDDGAPGDPYAGGGDSRAGDGDSVAGGDEIAGCSGTCTCENVQCDMTCPAGGCIIVCDGTDICEGSCLNGCTTECSGTSDCDLQCGSECDYECSGGAQCTVECDNECSMECEGNAACLLSCGESAECELECTTEVADCGGGVSVCGRSCP